jgi:hypothetical protein
MISEMEFRIKKCSQVINGVGTGYGVWINFMHVGQEVSFP